MTLEEILDGIEAALELERDLGVRELETGRAFAARRDAPASKPATAATKPPPPAPKPAPATPKPAAAPKPAPAAPGPAAAQSQAAAQSPAEIVFLLAEPPAAPAAKTMMDNIVAYVEKLSARKTAVVCGGGAPPPAQIYIAMGEKARESWFPGERFPAERISVSRDGKTVAMTRNPDDVVRFGSPETTKEIRRRMMQTFAAANRRLAGQ